MDLSFGWHTSIHAARIAFWKKPGTKTGLTEEQEKKGTEVVQTYIANALQVYTRLKEEVRKIKK